MDKNTMLAVILSVVVITVGFMVQNIFFAPAEAPAVSRTQEDSRSRDPQTTALPSPGTSGQAPAVMAPQAAVSGTVIPSPDDSVSVQNVVLETDLLHATFSTKGAILRSLKLKEHRDKDGFVDMVKTGTEEDGAFTLAFGGIDVKPLDTVFRFRKRDSNTLEFFREFQISGYENSTFRLTKSFSVRPGEYLVLLDVTLENVDNPNQVLPLNFNNIAYTLGYGPQTGPEFQKLDDRNDYRKFYYYSEGKRKTADVKAGNERELDQKANWVGIVGKYFALLAAPVYSDFQVTLSSRPMEGVAQTSMIFISRPMIKSSKNTDSYRFYAGPKVPSALGRYNDKGKNAFGIQNMQFDEALDSNIFLGWLENILKFLLRIFYGIIPNWGVAIILVTVAVKVVTFPLTQKSYKSTSRMQSLAPKMEELKKKYKDNPAKLNQETADLYKKEGINPMSGCLPMLLQIPVFFAMYGLFSNHFDLRGAAFLPPWITDLSAPESIWNFAPFTLPIVGWSDLRLLPILFVATQLLSGTMMQTPGTGSNAQMKMMTFGIPVVFFFVLYDVPSGLLVYWIVMNVLTIVQQMVISKSRKAKA